MDRETYEKLEIKRMENVPLYTKRYRPPTYEEYLHMAYIFDTLKIKDIVKYTNFTHDTLYRMKAWYYEDVNRKNWEREDFDYKKRDWVKKPRLTKEEHYKKYYLLKCRASRSVIDRLMAIDLPVVVADVKRKERLKNVNRSTAIDIYLGRV